MATQLRSRIEEDHLTCSICYNAFKAPKALPCLHTFCEHCLREYVFSRGYESEGQFPCPLCRVSVQIPAGGIDQFPNNHLVKSLSDTVDNARSRPVPKPRKTLQPNSDSKPADTNLSKAEEARATDPQVTDLPPPYTESNTATGGIPPPLQGGATPTPPYGYFGPMDGAGPPRPPLPQQPPPPPQMNPPPYFPPQPYPPAQSVMYNTQYPGYHPPPPMTTGPYPAPTMTQTPGMKLQATTISGTPTPGPPLYPTIPPSPSQTAPNACSLGLLFKFGKKGASVTDFHKPLGLAVSDSCDYIVTDTSGNRIFIFDYQGQPKKAFHCDCRVKDVAVNSKNEILVVVNKPAAVLRCYDMNGRCLREHGKSITHEESNGIALLFNGGAVITGKQNQSVYILTDQLKLSSKFGRKGTGDGYFQSPAFVATDTKGHIIVSDDINHNIQVFSGQGKFKVRFGGKGSSPGQLFHPLGVVTDADDNIIVADSGNCRVEMFTSRGSYLRTIVSGTDQLGEDVRPVNVAMTPKGDVAVLLKGNYFAEIRVYSPLTMHSEGANSLLCVLKTKQRRQTQQKDRRLGHFFHHTRV